MYQNAEFWLKGSLAIMSVGMDNKNPPENLGFWKAWHSSFDADVLIAFYSGCGKKVFILETFITDSHFQ